MASRRKRTLFSLFAIILLGLISLVLLEVALRATSSQSGNATFLLGKRWRFLVPVGIPEAMPDVSPTHGDYRAYDADLGWSIRPLGSAEDMYFSNEYGYRCDKWTHAQSVARREAEGIPPSDENEYDFVCIGDSFTHGDVVQSEESWPSYLAEIRKQSVANLGVGGYGIDQAVMRYETKYPRCRYVLLGLISGDLERATQLIYNFTYGNFKSKPLYAFDKGEVSVINRPALHGDALLVEYQSDDSTFFRQAKFSWDERLMQRSIFDVSYCYRTLKSVPVWKSRSSGNSIYLEDGERLTYCMQILTHLKDLAANRQAEVTIVIMGEGNSFREKAASEEKGTDNWQLLKSKLDAAGIAWIDTTPTIYAMYKEERDSVINSSDGVHYSPQANRKVAELVTEAFSDRR